MKPKLIILMLFSIMACWSLNAQQRWSIELRPGVNFATEDFGPVELKTGFGVEGTLAYKVMPHMATYIGWGWNQFSGDGLIENDLDFEETGYTFGLLFMKPITSYDIYFILAAGGIYNHLEIEGSNGDLLADTGHDLGWEVQTGLAFNLGVGFEVRPLVTYRSLSTTAKIGTVEQDLDLKYIAIGAGIVKTF